MSNDVKMVLVWRHDLKVRKGKIAAQMSHGAVGCILQLMKDWLPSYNDGNNLLWKTKQLTYKTDSPLAHWLEEKFKKVAVYAEDEAHLLDIYVKAKEAGLNCVLIQDVGDTEFHGQKTYTVVGIGPDESSKIDLVTGGLKLL